MEAALDNMKVNGRGCAPAKLYLRKEMVGWISPTNYDLPTLELEEQASQRDFTLSLDFRITDVCHDLNWELLAFSVYHRKWVLAKPFYS